MSDEGEKTCPLCAEEMDLTDQQLKPCKCGYEICVWCWHHIMDMAEKDHTEGRCPACRTPYNKEKIVGTASKCDRLVAEMGVEKKQKSQKGKTKTSEGRKQLSSVRVIQRNLVYIVGIPLNLADEDLLQRKEYFGQYGKVLKVSISRTAAGAIQQFANSTCSVYITYSKEEEAVRSIQSVHGFVLEGSPLRACFGTTKYCHAWLRNVPCTNPDCLYLHEFGSQEDSFSKDEVVSANSRGRVQQITSATNDMQRRSGNILPPPAEDYNNINSSWGKPISKSTTSNPANNIKVSPPNSSSGRSVTLPAAASWGIRPLNSQPPAANMVGSNGLTKQKADNEIVRKHSEESHSFEEKGKLGNTESRKVSNLPKDKNKSINFVPDFSSSSEISGHYTTPDLEKDLNVADEEKIHNLSSEMSLVSIDKNHGLQNLPQTSPPSNKSMVSSPQLSYGSINGCLDPPLMDQKLEKGPPHTFNSSMSPLMAQTSPPSNKSMGNSLQKSYVSINGCLDSPLMDQNLEKGPPHTFNSSMSPLMAQTSPPSNKSISNSPQKSYVSINGCLDPPLMDQNLEKGPPHTFNSSMSPLMAQTSPSNKSMGSSPQQSYVSINGCSDPPFVDQNLEKGPPYTFNRTNGHASFIGTEGDMNQMGKYEDLGESSIISNILSMEFDPWDESLTSPQNLAKLFGENDKQQGSHRVSSSRKAQNSNQSRFSFAREDECIDQRSNLAPNHQNFSNDFVTSRDVYLEKHNNGNGFSSFSFEESDNFAISQSPMSANKVSVSRAQVSAPPGFSGLSRAPPPGFNSHERIEQTSDNLSGNYMFDTSSLRKLHNGPAPVNIGSIDDLELMDPAILAVGGRVPGVFNSSPDLNPRSSFPSHLSSFENDSRLQLLMQRPFAPQQNQRFTELTNGYGIPSRIVEQSLPSYQQPRSSLMSNSHWNGWNEVQSGNDIAMAEYLRNERLGFNKYYSGYEDTKFRMNNSGDLYNRFGI